MKAMTPLISVCLLASTALADPCGMVPPIYTGEGVPITRIGAQQTYVFYKDGVETFAIRPGFQGKVEQFGMLIPFPTPPAIRKLPDNIFPHIAAAIDPPEVVIDLLPRPQAAAASRPDVTFDAQQLAIRRKAVRVLREEAVGMYEVAVLEAGSAKALKRWMDQHGYRYPEGMDKVCEEYVEEKWCFVAVKTRVGDKARADASPGQRVANPRLPSGSTFDGHVQAMGFRFKSDDFVVPMRLSAFNKGELRNVVYLLTDGPRKIRAIPEEYVVRQLSGIKLYENLTQPLPLRILGGKVDDLTDYRRRNLAQRRDPTPHSGGAKDLFASDLLAVESGQLSLEHEEKEKELLQIGEYLGLRGDKIDQANAQALSKQREQTARAALDAVKKMTLTVVDGDFPRDVLANQNLTFAEYAMSAERNRPEVYDAREKGPGRVNRRGGTVHYGEVSLVEPRRERHGVIVGVVLALVAASTVVRLGRSSAPISTK